MKLIIIAFITGIAGFMAYLFATGGDCRGGQVVTDAAQCRNHFDAASCAAALAASDRKARTEYSPFLNREDCEFKFPICIAHAVIVGGFVPRPSGICLARIDGRVDGTPVYTRIGQQVQVR